MKFLFCIIRKRKSRVISYGKSLDILVVASVVCKRAAEEISQKNKIDEKRAMEIVLEGVKETQSHLIQKNT